MTIPATTPADGELLPCPFCGMCAEHWVDMDTWRKEARSISCSACPANTGPCETAEQAAEAWNTRATPSPGKAPEPVAWRHPLYSKDGNYQMGWAYSSNIPADPNSQPLYASPRKADERDAWQPIETAPKDGTPVMLYARSEKATAPVVVIGWCLYGHRWVECAFAPNLPVGLVPTHWQPLPAPPKQEADPQ